MSQMCDLLQAGGQASVVQIVCVKLEELESTLSHGIDFTVLVLVLFWEVAKLVVIR